MVNGRKNIGLAIFFCVYVLRLRPHYDMRRLYLSAVLLGGVVNDFRNQRLHWLPNWQESLMVHGRLDHTRINMDVNGNQTEPDQNPRGEGLFSSQQKPWTLRRGIGRAIITCLEWGVSVLMLGIFIAERIFDAE